MLPVMCAHLKNRLTTTQLLMEARQLRALRLEALSLLLPSLRHQLHLVSALGPSHRHIFPLHSCTTWQHLISAHFFKDYQDHGRS